MHVFPIRTVPWRALASALGTLVAVPIAVVALALWLAPAISGWLFVLLVSVALGLMLAVQIALIVAVLFVATRNEITLRGGTMHLKGGEFHERVPLDHVVSAEVVERRSTDGLSGLTWRNGIALPGFRVGWYQRPGGRYVFVLTAAKTSLLHVVTDMRFDVLLGVDEPAALAERLSRNAPEDRD